MNCTAKGVGLTAAEARVLLKFASKEEADRDKYGVKIVVEGDRVWARATNGMNQLELDGESDGKLPDGEWFVHREFLEKAVKLVVGVKAVLRLAFSGASLNHAIVEENGVETGSFDVPADAAIADVSFPWGKGRLKPPTRTRAIAHCSALPGDASTLLSDVEAAVGVSYSDIYPPTSLGDPWMFVTNDSGQTVATGTLKAAKSAAATDGTGDDPDTDADAPKGRGKKRGGRQQELVS